MRPAPYLPAVGLVLLALGLQWWDGVFGMELTRHSDEPAHFVTAVMVHDYVTRIPLADPITFAEEYYCRFPKMAFGHWPPGLHTLLGGWFLITGATPAAASLLLGLTAGAVAIVLVRRVRAVAGSTLAVLIAVGFLTATPIRTELAQVMAELPLLLFSTLAVFAFGDFLDSGRAPAAARFALWATAAVLTKGNGLALALLPLFAIALTGRFRALRSPWLWVAGLGVGLATAPVYYLTYRMATAVGSGDGLSETYLLRNLTVVPQQLVGLFGIPLLGLAAVAAARCLAGNPTSPNEGPRVGRLALASVLATLVFQIAVPITGESRYLLPALPGLMMLAAEALRGFGGWVGRFSQRAGRVVPLLGGVALVVAGAGSPSQASASGYREVARGIPLSEGGTVVLISSDTRGEGAFVAERLVADRGRTGFVLRASKVLGDDSWMGKEYRIRIESEEALRRYLDETRVHYVVVDDSPWRLFPKQPHHTQLVDFLRRHPDEFPRVGEYSVGVSGGAWNGLVSVYLCRAAEGLPPGRIRVDMTRMLNRDIGLGRQ